MSLVHYLPPIRLAGVNSLDLNHEWASRSFEREDEMHTNQINAAIEAASAGLKSLIILNGGACLSLLTFLGSILSEKNSSESAERLFQSIISALKSFSFGAGVAVFVLLLSYVINRAYAEAISSRERSFEWPYIRDNIKTKRWLRLAIWLNIVGVILALASMFLFFHGLFRLSY